MGFQGLIRSISDHAMPSGLRGLYLGFGSADVSAMNLPSALLMGAVVALALWGTWRLRPTELFRGLALWTAVFFLIYRQVWEYHYLMFLPVLACTYLATGARWSVWAWVLLAAPTPFLLLTSLAGGSVEQSSLWILHHAAKPVAVAIAFAALLPWRVPAPAAELRARRARLPAEPWFPAAPEQATPATLRAVKRALARARAALPAGAREQAPAPAREAVAAQATGGRAGGPPEPAVAESEYERVNGPAD
jgi:hypothetical protein